MKNFVEKLQKIGGSKAFLIVFAIFLAIIAWFAVMDSTNPRTDMTYDIPIVFENVNAATEKGLTILDDIQNMRASVKVSCRQKLMDKVSASDFSITVDLGKIEKSGEVKFKVEEPECEKLGVKVIDYSPKEIEIKCDKKVEIQLPVEVVNDDKAMKDGYKCIAIVTEPETITMTGFSSELEDLERIELDLSKQIAEKSVDRNKTLQLIGRFITKAGTDVTTKYDSRNVQLKLSVAKRIPIKYNTTGTPARDCYLDNVTLSENDVWVKISSEGNDEELQKLNQIDLGTIDINGFDKTTEVKFDVASILGSHFEVVEGDEQVKVNVFVSKATRQNYSVPKSSIELKGYDDTLFDYDIVYKAPSAGADSILVTIKGKSSDLEKITASTLKPIIEIQSSVGVYHPSIKFNVPDNVEIIGEYIVDITVKNKPGAEENVEPNNEMP